MKLQHLLPLLALPLAVHAQHEFACTDYTGGKVFLVGQDGAVTWEYPAPQCNDLWVLPNGNLLFNTGHGVREVTRDKKIVFDYQSKNEIYACQRLPNGNTFVGECNSGRLLEVAPDGKTIVKEVRILPEGKNGGHSHMRNARVLPNGHYLCCMYGEQVVREFDSQGQLIREIKAPGGPHSAARLPNGNTLIAVADRVKSAKGIETGLIEVDKDGQIVWRITNDDLPGAPLKFMAGFHRLPNGNTIMSNWLGHGHLGKAPHLLEVTPDKKLVWTYENHKDMKTISSVVLLGVPAESAH